MRVCVRCARWGRPFSIVLALTVLLSAVDGEAQSPKSPSRGNRPLPAPPPVQQPPRDPAMTNADVIALVEAGLPDAVIVEKIRQSPTAFDTSAAALIALKRASVSTAVIQVMVNPRSTSDAVAAGAILAPSAAAPEVCSAGGNGAPTYLTGASPAMWYARQPGEQRIEMQYERGTLQRVGFMGIGATLLLLKPKAGQLRLPAGVVFYSCINPTESPLVRFTVDDEDNERHTSVQRGALWKESFRISDGDLVPMTFTKLPQGFFEVQVRSPLGRGEYGFVPQVGANYFVAGERVYAFGVD